MNMLMEPQIPNAVAEFFDERAGELWCESVSLSRIGDEVGTPCYVYSETAIRRRYHYFVTAFASIPARVLYSVKANHNLAILRTMQNLGAGADVVSLGELHRAQLADFKGRDIVFGGVGKRRDEIAAALAAGVFLINVESEAELRLIDELAAALDVQAPVAVRVNPGIETATHDYTQTGHYRTKFGVALEDAEELFSKAMRLNNVEPIGIDTHIGSQIHTPEPYREALRRLGELGCGLRRSGIEVRYLDIGGGFGVRYEGGAGIDLAAVAEVAGEVASELDVTCLLEPGRWLVSPAGVLLARVLYVKTVGQRVYCVTDTGVNDFMRPSYYGAYHPVVAVKREPVTMVAEVVGPVCETGDFLAHDCPLPQLREGDVLCVFFAGAYGSVMSSNYNSRPRAPEVVVRGNTFEIARRRETLDDLVAAEDLRR
jgi:diaminopimelate decarboxylase